MKHSFENRRSIVENITSAMLASEIKHAFRRHDCGAEAMQVVDSYERPGLVIETSRLKARRHACVAGILRSCIY